MTTRRLALAALLVLTPLPAGAVTIEAVTSPGGITAWLVEDHSLPVVTLEASFRGGAALDPADRAGLATLTCDLLDEGAGELDSSAYHGRLEDLASSVSFDAGLDTVDIGLRTVTANVAPAFELLRLALTQPRFDAPAVERVRGQLVASLDHDRHQPRFIADRRWRDAALGQHPYARSARGTPASLARIAPADMRRFIAERLAKDAMIVAAVGDITPDALKALLDKTFGALPAHAAPAAVGALAFGGKGALLLARMPIPQSVVEFGEAGIMRNDPDWYAALLDNQILGGGGLTSRLTEEVREKRGLAYSVFSALDPMDHGGLIMGGVATENARVAQSIALIRSEWRRMQQAGPTEAELAGAKTYLTGSFPLNLDSTGRIASVLVTLQHDGLGIDYLERRSALIDQVSLADAKRVAKRLFDADALTFVVVGQPPALPGAREVSAELP